VVYWDNSLSFGFLAPEDGTDRLSRNIGKNIPTYIQQDATLHILFYLETALHVSGGTYTHHQERKQLYLQHLVFVTPLLLPAAIAVLVVMVGPVGPITTNSTAITTLRR